MKLMDCQDEIRNSIGDLAGILKIVRKRRGLTDQEYMLCLAHLHIIQKRCNEVLSGKTSCVYRFFRRTLIRR